ncbi:Dam family site-specific DNA-(adenine-N6)-methyltransferase [Pseudodesulfovibrio thermohalotolerans]|uniref:Dam family site-specific DNA-(adenine-N6)-methyltransferase n=1 Tax=Pseudodesulfovibrio thermohalotolerans TaxID=2880651 RepID=UPI00244233F2|nr:Dam family site-specific DNA-(adenine-N6)-methyltransferase [Pseudodesulfovibrio thermohalotolerans]WFS63989.1 Dam family site-specific DNA-(adenine-N6)-methyltransferase [Pseudodesulfovibrio thermohalotolerans]
MANGVAVDIDGGQSAKPILKWAGGKSQMLDILVPLVPPAYGKYIEPFFGGGALFFSMAPANAVIADSNPELVNLYRVVADQVDELILALRPFKNSKTLFYETRAQDWRLLTPVQAAARTVFLNRTCYNGLYRVNKKGGFNVPFGNYANPNICDVASLRQASIVLRGKTIVCGDYKDVLRENAKRGDFVFLDPPYLPISEYSDFKRYTKEQFYEEDHRELAEEVGRLRDLGCHVVLTNSNHPLVHDLYGKYKVDVFQTRRNISSKGRKRTGEDVVVTVKPRRRFSLHSVPKPVSGQAEMYPTTRYMGSKTKLLPHIRDIIRQFDCKTVLDLFSGSGVVSYMMKAEGKQVVSNDYMALCSTYTKALVENNSVTLPEDVAISLLVPNGKSDSFVQDTFHGLYFTDKENELIDNIRANIKGVRNPYQRSIATAALCRACFKKRPRGIFTYVGYRHDDGRKDLRMSFEDQFLEAVQAYNDAVFDNGQENRAVRGDAMMVRNKPDLVYMDPPYFSQHSDNEYVRRYHFAEGIACDWQDVEMQWHTKTKKFKSYPTPFSTRNGAYDAFDKLFKKFRDSIQVVSYSSNSLPTLDEMVELMSKYKRHVEVIAVDYKYSFGTQGHKVGDNNNTVKEYIFVGY